MTTILHHNLTPPGVRVLFLSGLFAGAHEEQAWEAHLPSVMQTEDGLSSLQERRMEQEGAELKQRESLLSLVAPDPAEAWLTLDSTW